MRFHDGDTVLHRTWGTTGTVRVFEEAAEDEAQAEVAWHGTNVADELDLVADELQVIG